MTAKKHVYVTCEVCLEQKIAFQLGPFPPGHRQARINDEHGCPWQEGECPECQTLECLKPPKPVKRDCTNCGRRILNANRYFCRICWQTCDGTPLPVLTPQAGMAYRWRG